VTGAKRLVAHPACAPLLCELLTAEVRALAAAAAATAPGVAPAVTARLAALAGAPVTVLLLSGGLGREVRALKKAGGEVGEAAGRVVDAWKAAITQAGK
jgi:hypothetical protein